MPNDLPDYAVVPRAAPHDVLGWMLEFARLAPDAPHMLLWILARLLADKASPDALLIISDALREASTQIALNGVEAAAAGLDAIADAIGDEVAKRSRPARLE
jgi:hypothetical protein